MSDQKISARSLIPALAGNEKIPLGTLTDQATTPDQIVASLIPGIWDASSNAWPSTRNDGGVIKQGSNFDIIGNSTILVDVNENLISSGGNARALITNPGSIAANWKVTYG